MPKTPQVILLEICAKKHKPAPVYELMFGGSGSGTQFTYNVTALDETIEGYGKSKREAKHEAAAALLRKLELHDFSEAEAPTPDAGTSVSDLHDLCVARRIPTPQFNLVNVSGSSHSPNFTVECRVESVTRLASHSTKKGARQLAANKMLQVFQEISTECSDLNIINMEDLMIAERDQVQGAIRTYREIKKSDIKKIPGVSLYDRCHYFVRLDEDKVAKARQILTEDLASIDKVKQIFDALDLKYKITDIKSKMYGKKAFWELVGCDYDACIAGTYDEIYDKVIEYMTAMLA